MAHLKTQQTNKKPEERKTWKFSPSAPLRANGERSRTVSLIRRLYELELQEKDIRNLYRFIDWVMI